MDLARDLLGGKELNKSAILIITYKRGKFYLCNSRYRRTAEVEK
jgi:hypothetical protein